MLTTYHANYLKRSDQEIERRLRVKKEELAKIFEAVPFHPTNEPLRIAVTGCADVRFVAGHKKIFEELLGKKVELTTFDINSEHLAGAKNIVQHDCSQPLPNSPYDLTFGHVLLKFIETEKQWSIIQNTYNALSSPGLAIHVFDEEDITTKEIKQKDGLWSVPLDRWTQELTKANIRFKVLNWDINIPDMEIPIRGLKGGALLLIKE